MAIRKIEDYVREAEGYEGIQIQRGGKFCYVIRHRIAASRKGNLATPRGYAAAHLHDLFRGKFREAESHIPFSTLQFIDIETTGLRRTEYTWLIGTARLDTSRGLCLEMLLARDPTEEAAIMQRMMEMTQRRPWWISFNGKSFDNHRILDRAKANLIKPGDPEYLDLYHLAKRKFKTRNLEKHNLATFEKLIFPKHKRKDHIPSKEIPEEVEKYIEGGDGKKLWDSIVHCVDDVGTTFALYIHILKKELEERKRILVKKK